MANEALRQQIENDPRVQAAAEAKRRGDQAGYLSPQELRQFYPQAPPDWGYLGDGGQSRGWRSGGAGVVDNYDAGDKYVGLAASTLLPYGVDAAREWVAPPPLPSSRIDGPLHEAVPGAPAVPPGAGGGPGASPNMPRSLLDRILSPQGAQDVLGLIPSIASLFRGNTSGPFGSGPEADALTRQIQDSLASQQRRFDATEPAFNTAQNMAIGMAPTRYRSGPFGGSR